jgi:tetratricopeptide (TPR) repeat protein
LTARLGTRRERAQPGGTRRREPTRFFEDEVNGFQVVLIAALVAAPLLLGSVPRWAVGVLLAISVVLALGLLLLPALRNRSVPWFGVVLMAVALFIGLQLVPLPSALVALLSPHAEELYRATGVPEAMRRFHPLSLDGPGTGVELAKALVCAVVFTAAFVLSRRERARRRLCMALVGAGVLVALIGYGHRLANVDRLFGLFRFRDVTPPFLTTLANKNNQAGLFCLCAPSALVLALSAGERKRAILWGVCYVLLGAAVFLTLSRGGITAFVLGQVLVLLLLPPSAASLSVRGALTALVLVIAAYLALSEISGRLVTLAPGSVSKEFKLQGMRESTRMLLDYPLVGIGRGAFPTAGARYLDVPLGTAEFIENETLQPLVDLGWLMGALLLVSALVLWFRAVRPLSGTSLERPLLAVGLGAGVASLFIQNQVDFSLEIAGVAIPAMMAMGALAATGKDLEPKERRARGSISAWQFATVALVLAVPACVGLAYGKHDWRFEIDRFVQGARDVPGFPALLEQAEPLARRHPASFVVPLTLADRGLRERPPQRGAAIALDYVNRALTLKPSSPEAHLVAAEALAMLSRKEQSLLEARLYFEASDGDDRALRRAFVRTPGLEDLLQAVPDTPTGFAVLQKALEQRSRWDDVLAVADAWLRVAPDSAQAHRYRGEALRAKGLTSEAEKELRQAVEVGGQGPDEVADLAALLMESGDVDGARQVLARGLLAQPGQLDLCVALARLEIAAGRPEAASLALHQARVVGAVERSKVLELGGDVENALGHGNRAFALYDQAASLAPGSAAPWKAVTQLEKMSRYEEAQVYLGRLKATAGPDLATQLSARIDLDAKKANDLRLSREAVLREAAHEVHEVDRKGGAP